MRIKIFNSHFFIPHEFCKILYRNIFFCKSYQLFCELSYSDKYIGTEIKKMLSIEIENFYEKLCDIIYMEKVTNLSSITKYLYMKFCLFDLCKKVWNNVRFSELRMTLHLTLTKYICRADDSEIGYPR